MASFDPLASFIARAPGKARVTAACGAVFGALALVWGVYDISRIPWELDARSPTTPSTSARCGTFSGALYTIEVAGQSFTCEGAETKCPPAQHALVAYDPEEPWRCRRADRVGRPTFAELSGVAAAIAALGYALAVFAGSSTAFEGTGARGSGAAYRLGRGVLVVAGAIGFVTWLARVFGQGVP